MRVKSRFGKLVLIMAIISGLVGPFQVNLIDADFHLPVQSEEDDPKIGGDLLSESSEIGTTDQNHPPVADFTWSPTLPNEGEAIQFLDTSLDPDDDIVNWSWDFGDGTTSYVRNASHVYGHAGKYAVSLNVTDSGGSFAEGRFVTRDAHQQRNPDVFGDLVVWQDDRNGDSDIYMYNISTDTETLIGSGPNIQIYPEIQGLHVVWIEQMNDTDSSEVFLYNISTNVTVRITNDSCDHWRPDIWGDKIVWIDDCDPDTGADVYAFDVVTKSKAKILSSPHISYGARIFQDRVVWVDWRNLNRDVYLYNLTSLTEVQVTTDPNDQYGAAIQGDRVVWMDMRNGWTDIYYYDFAAGKEISVSETEAYDTWPAIWGDNMVWTRAGLEEGLYLHNVATNETTRLRSSPPVWTFVAIHSDLVVCDIFEEGNESGNHDIYLLDLSAMGTEPLSDAKSVDVTVVNVAPSVDVWAVVNGSLFLEEVTISEGQQIQLGGSFDDPSWLDNHTVTWDFGDGQSVQGSFTPGLGYEHHVMKEVMHGYGDDGGYYVTLEVTDDCGDSALDSILVRVDNLDPEIRSFSSSSGSEGSDLSFPVIVSDPGSDDLTFVLDWGDGTTDTLSYYNDGLGPDPYPSPFGEYPFDVDVSVEHKYGDNGLFTVVLTVEDDDGGVSTATVAADISNVEPSINVGGPYYGDENSPVEFISTAVDPGSDDLTFVWDWGDGTTDAVTFYNDGVGPDPPKSPWGTYPFEATHTITHVWGDNGNFTVTLTVMDDDGALTVEQTVVSVNNVAPTIESIVYYLNASFAFRVAGEKWHNIEIYLYEDGTEIGYASITRYPGSPNEQMVTLADISIDFSKTYSAVAYYTPEDDPINGQIWGATPAWVILEYEDGKERIHHTFNVRHEDTWTWVIDDLSPYFLGHNITFMATASDPGSDDLTFTWDWGDGNTTENVYYNDGIGPDPYPSPEVNPITVTDTVRHGYGLAGTYVITLTVTDDDGGVTPYSLNLTL